MFQDLPVARRKQPRHWRCSGDYGDTVRFTGALGTVGSGVVPLTVLVVLHAVGIGPSNLSTVAVTSTAARPDWTVASMIL